MFSSDWDNDHFRFGVFDSQNNRSLVKNYQPIKAIPLTLAFAKKANKKNYQMASIHSTSLQTGKALRLLLHLIRVI